MTFYLSMSACVWRFSWIVCLVARMYGSVSGSSGFESRVGPNIVIYSLALKILSNGPTSSRNRSVIIKSNHFHNYLSTNRLAPIKSGPIQISYNKFSFLLKSNYWYSIQSIRMIIPLILVTQNKIFQWGNPETRFLSFTSQRI